jgi:hypothetical protein
MERKMAPAGNSDHSQRWMARLESVPNEKIVKAPVTHIIGARFQRKDRIAAKIFQRSFDLKATDVTQRDLQKIERNLVHPSPVDPCNPDIGFWTFEISEEAVPQKLKAIDAGFAPEKSVTKAIATGKLSLRV